MRTCTIFLLTILLGLSTGCHVNRARDVKPTEVNTRTPADAITITGSYSLGEDGEVAYNLQPRPNGDLVGERSVESIRGELVDGWIRSTTSNAGGSIACIISIVGPYREDPDDLEDPLVYDITLEVWMGRSNTSHR